MVARSRIELNQENTTLQQVRVAMDCSPAKKGFSRLQALLWLYEGKSREGIAALRTQTAFARLVSCPFPSCAASVFIEWLRQPRRVAGEGARVRRHVSRGGCFDANDASTSS